MEQNLRIEAVANELNCSVQTIRYWYRWKKLCPEHELAKLLPTPFSSGRQLLWSEEDVQLLWQFKKQLPHGKKGVLGDETQKYYRRKKENGK